MSTLLLIEDDPLLGPLYCELLGEAGYTVTHVYRTDDIKRTLKKQRYSRVLLDVMLPEQSGLELLEDQELWQGQKVVILTNLDQEQVVRRALALGAVGYLIKSEHTPETFIQAVQKFSCITPPFSVG